MPADGNTLQPPAAGAGLIGGRAAHRCAPKPARRLPGVRVSCLRDVCFADWSSDWGPLQGLGSRAVTVFLSALCGVRPVGSGGAGCPDPTGHRLGGQAPLCVNLSTVSALRDGHWERSDGGRVCRKGCLTQAVCAGRWPAGPCSGLGHGSDERGFLLSGRPGPSETKGRKSTEASLAHVPCDFRSGARAWGSPRGCRGHSLSVGRSRLLVFNQDSPHVMPPDGCPPSL